MLKSPVAREAAVKTMKAAIAPTPIRRQEAGFVKGI
jgi:hypothetical protein